MTVSFGDDATADLYHGRNTHRFRRFVLALQRVALRKLDDLREPPGNRLETLAGVLLGYHSIRVNQQWRLVFRWQGNNAYDVSLTDYH